MNNRAKDIAIGFVIGAATLLVMGQNQPWQPAKPHEVGRYHMVSTIAGGVAVQDTTTGEVRYVNGPELATQGFNPFNEGR